MEKWMFEIKGMHCKSCSKMIEQELSKVEGVMSAKAHYPQENAEIQFDSKIVSKSEIEDHLNKIGYSIKGSNKQPKSSTLKQALIYGLIPHIGCIGFIIASILGSTLLVNIFRPLMLSPHFFYILIAISVLFSSVAIIFYLNPNELLSFKGAIKKKNFIATMYAITISVNLLLMFVIFPMLANVDTGSFSSSGAYAQGISSDTDSLTLEKEKTITLSVAIPCPGHASLITGDLKKVSGVTGVKYNYTDIFEVRYVGDETRQNILDLEVFNTYPARIVSEEN